MPAFDMKLDKVGWRELLDVLDEIPARVRATVVAQASRDTMRPILNTMRSHLRGSSERTGLLRRSLGIVQRKSKSRGTVYTIVGPRRGYKKQIGTDGSGRATYANPVNYAHLVEFGTLPHWIAPKNRSGALKIKRGHGPSVIVRGAVWHPGARAKPFMRTAFDAHRNSAIPHMAGNIRTRILKMVARYERKAAEGATRKAS